MENDLSNVATQTFAYPDDQKVYGIMVTNSVSNALIKLGLSHLAQRDGDLLVFLCHAGDDVRNRVGWEELEALIGFRNGKRDYQVRELQSDVDLYHASMAMRVLRLPEHPEVRSII